MKKQCAPLETPALLKNEINSSLLRTIGLFPLLNIVVANMIGAGIFTTSGLLMETLGNPLIMLGLWGIGGMVALCGALSYGELGATFPQAGGEYAFLTRLYHPMFGFLSGWTSLIAGFSAPAAASAIGISKYLFRAFHYSALVHGVQWLSPETIQKVLSIFIILLFTIIHAHGNKWGTRVQNFLTVIKILLITGLISAGFAFGNGSWEHFNMTSSVPLDLSGFKNIGLSLMWIMFAYSGWNAATYVGSEVKKPGRNLPLSLIMGTGIVVLLYISLNLFFIYTVKPQEMYGVVSIGGLAVAHAFGPGWESALSILIAFALFSSLSAFIILGPRVYYAMASDGVFFKSLAIVHSRYKVPSRAISVQSGIACIMVLTGTFDQILTFMGFALGLFPLICVCGIFKLRHKNLTKLKISGFPIAPALFIIASISILVLAFMQRPLESGLAVATVLTGMPVYAAFRHNKTHI